ncbi:hypothetical protein A0H81_00128 [Grifola frondosa]|uniref:Uncharacterized protein n=1 Tax=Grifola frondosa TaxID=5627 RepID=A0A1C7MTU0_GRIFR|nr:hypothetical protein A0H81_00128 [Grifola frondosa]
MSSFKFPPSADDVRVMRHSAPASPPSSGSARDFSLNTSTKPFTFSGFASSLPFMPKETTPLPHPLVSTSQTTEGDEENLPIVPSPDPIDEDAKSAEELPFPPAAKPKRAPIPLDFKHPVSTNTVPAGLFKLSSMARVRAHSQGCSIKAQFQRHL